MKRLVTGILVLAFGPILAHAEGASATINGYIIDSACLYIKKLDKPVSKECAVSCAKAGSPLVILADDGTVYLPISSDMPATGQNQRLMKFAGEKVSVKGKVFERGGSHAILIEDISEPSVAR